MTYEEAFAVELQYSGVVVHGYFHLVFEVVEHPHVVVSDEEVQFDSCVGEVGHPPEETDETFGYYIFIGKPEVEHVAKEHHFGGIVFYAVEQCAELPFPFQGIGACPQVGIGDEI